MADESTVRALQEALEATPDNIPLLKLLAGQLCELGREAEAEDHYRKVLRAQPEDLEAQVQLSATFAAQGKWSQAHVILESLVQRDLANARVYFALAQLHRSQGQLAQAVHAYRRALDVDPTARDPELAAKLGLDTGGAQTSSPQAAYRESLTGMPDSFGGDTPGDEGSWEETPHSKQASPLPIERPNFGFDGVGGMDSLKEEIELKIIEPMRNPELFAAYGKKSGGGMLMYGPPGCGKTHLARATAGQIEAPLFCVGLHDVLSMWLGESEARIHALFEEARRNTPCVLFFDEVDALGAKRSDMRSSAGRTTINAFLNELDGAASSNEGILVLAATNAPWQVDPAFRRPGRFDSVLFVPPPDAEARAEILKVLLRGKPVANLAINKLIAKTKDFSGADLRGVVDMALELKLREVLKTKKRTPLSTSDLVATAKKARPTTKEWFATARNHALYSNEGGLYDDVLDWLNLS